MAVAIKIISASGDVRTVEVEPGKPITLEPGETVVLLPDAETAIATSQDGDNLVVETPDGTIVLAQFFAAADNPATPRARAFGAAPGADESGLESALVFADTNGLTMITAAGTFVSAAYTLPTYEGSALPETGSLTQEFFCA
jgi:hypothetical protein